MTSKTPQTFGERLRETWNRASEEAIKKVLKDGKIQGSLINQAEHPEFYGSLADLARRSGLEYVPHVIISETMPNTPVWMRKLPNAGAGALRTVLVSESLMELAGASAKRAITPELETVLAHEFSHLRDGVIKDVILKRTLPVFGLPLLMVGGLYLYDRARANTPPKAGESLKDHAARLTHSIHHAAKEEAAKAHEEFNQAQKSGTEGWALDPHWQERILHQSRYLLAAAVGLAGGLLIARNVSAAAEFRADAFSMKVTQNPEAFERLMNQARAAFKEARKNRPPHDNWLLGKIHAGYDWLVRETMHYHPSNEERFAFTRRVAQEQRALNALEHRPM